MNNALENIVVLVTRPKHQAQTFCQMVEAAGGKPVHFPTIEIRKLPLDIQAWTILQKATNCIIFISANAVRLGVPAIQQMNPKRLKKSCIMAIGRATAEQLEAQGIGVGLVPPTPYNSEALLAMPEMKDVSGKTFTIIKGRGGRRHLMEQLGLRGAYVNEIDVYTRARPKIDNTPLTDLMMVDKVIVSVTSVKGLHHLFEITNDEQAHWLKTHARFLVPGDRVAYAARDFHIRHAPLIAKNATDAAMFNCLIHLI